MPSYTKTELQQNLKNELSSIENLYKSPVVNWKGKTKDTNEDYTNLIADELLMNLNLFNSINQVTRNSSYKIDSHSKIEIDCSSNRHEEIFAKRITGLSFDELGKIIDYQVPLKNSQNDCGLGKIDLLSFNEETKTLYLIELKYKGNDETLLRATLESYTYIKTIDKNKLVNDYFNNNNFILNKTSSNVSPNEIKVKPAVLLTPDCYAYDELEDVELGEKPKIKALLLALKMNVFKIDISTNKSFLKMKKESKMSRIIQSSDSKGSLRDIQRLVNQYPDYLSALISNKIQKLSSKDIDWVSPIESDDFAEYRDCEFLKKIGLSLNDQLQKFWPSKGPQWDALGKSINGEVFLVEAKANIPEVVSEGTKASSQTSVKMINEALKKTKDYLGITNDIDWSSKFYQYANRIAHLYFLRELNRIPAYLINIYFYNDKTVDSPTCKKEWMGAIKVLKKYLGIPKNHKLSAFMLDLFIDMNDLQ